MIKKELENDTKTAYVDLNVRQNKAEESVLDYIRTTLNSHTPFCRTSRTTHQLLFKSSEFLNA